MSKAEAYLNEALSLLVLFSYSSFTALDAYIHLAAYLDVIDTYHGYVWGLQLFPLLPLYIRRLALQVSIFCSEVIPLKQPRRAELVSASWTAMYR